MTRRLLPLRFEPFIAKLEQAQAVADGHRPCKVCKP